MLEASICHKYEHGKLMAQNELQQRVNENIDIFCCYCMAGLRGKDNIPSAVLVQGLSLLLLPTFCHSKRSMIWKPKTNKEQDSILIIVTYEQYRN